MSKRLQVVMSDREFEEISQASEASGQTISEWVRVELRQARRGQASEEIAEKLATPKSTAAHSLHTGGT